MSGYKTHILIYLVSVLSLLFLVKHLNLLELPVESMLSGVLIGVLYSILPDIDVPSSVMRRILGRVSLAVMLVLLTAYLFLKNMVFIHISIFLALFLYLLWFSHHRGFFHSITAAVLFTLPLLFIDPVIAGFAFYGFLNHLIVDGELSLI